MFTTCHALAMPNERHDLEGKGNKQFSAIWRQAHGGVCTGAAEGAEGEGGIYAQLQKEEGTWGWGQKRLPRVGDDFTVSQTMIRCLSDRGMERVRQVGPAWAEAWGESIVTSAVILDCLCAACEEIQGRGGGRWLQESTVGLYNIQQVKECRFRLDVMGHLKDFMQEALSVCLRRERKFRSCSLDR